MSYVTNQSIRFVCHPLFKSCSWHRTEIYDNVEASCYVETWSANAICQGIFRSFLLGSNSIQIICCVDLFGVHVWPVVMCVSPVQNCCYKNKESKILLCCLTWHSHCFKNSQSQIWGMLEHWLIKYEIVVCICMCMFVCLQTARASPLRPTGDVTEAESHQAAYVEVMEMHQCKWEQKGVLKECQ